MYSLTVWENSKHGFKSFWGCEASSRVAVFWRHWHQHTSGALRMSASHQGVEGRTETCRLQKRRWRHLVFRSEFQTWNHHSQESAEVCENPPGKWCSLGLDQVQVVAIGLGGQHEHGVSNSHDSHGPSGTDKVWSDEQGNTSVHQGGRQPVSGSLHCIGRFSI